ncbi:MAG: MMPL family transporter [Nocardioides sp.]
MTYRDRLDVIATTSPTRRTNLAGRMGRWSAEHRAVAIVGWFVLCGVLGVVGFTQSPQEYDPGDGTGEVAEAARIIDRAEFADDPPGEQVLIQTRTGSVQDPAVQAAIDDTVAALNDTDHVTNVLSIKKKAGAGLVSEDGRSTLVTFDLEEAAWEDNELVQPALDAVASVQRQHPDLVVEQFGDVSANKAVDDAIGDDLRRAELLSVAVTAGILLGVFAAVLAALLPMVLALTAFVASLGLLSLGSALVKVDQNATIVMLLIGVAVGVDYSLFYIRREREERAAGRDPRQALLIAAETSGRSVLISGITVLIAMGGLFFAGDATFIAIGWGTMLVVAVAMLGSLTFLPATLAALGHRLEWLPVPILRRFRTTRDSRVWGAVLRPVLRRPFVAAVVGIGAMVVLAVPAFSMRTALPGFSDELPDSIPVKATYERIQEAFPGGAAPATVAIWADNVEDPKVQSAIEDLRRAALATGVMNNPIEVETSPNNRVALVSVPLDGTGSDDASIDALRTLRQSVIPSTIGAEDGVRVAVTGDAAYTAEFNDTQRTHAPLVFGFVLFFAFVLLLVSFRSVVVAVTAIALNLLSVAAAYGVLVAAFQWGWAEGLLGFESSGSIASWLPMFLFVLLFGLSMDYHVFILSRIREAFDRGNSTSSAIRHGVMSTAGVITSAAVIMIAVFAIFASLSQLSLKQFGVGLAVAVFLDATVVRGVILPAVMMVLGERNWWLPGWLSWLPTLSHGERSDAESAAPAIAEPASAGAGADSAEPDFAGR